MHMLRTAIVTLLAATAWAQTTDPSVLETTEVRFAIEADTASSVSVVGDFNGWDLSRTPLAKDDKGTWRVRTDLRKGKVYDYAFVVDGHWILDPKNPLRSMDGRLSVIEVPGGAGNDDVNGSGVETIRLMLKRMDEKLSCCTDEVAALKKQVVSQGETIDRKDAQIDLLRKDLDDSRTERTTMTKDLTEARIHLDEVSQRYATLKAEADKGTGESDKASKKAADLQKAYRDLQEKMNAFLQEKRIAEERATKAEADRADAEKRIQVLEQKYEQLAKTADPASASDEPPASRDAAPPREGPNGHDLKPLASTHGVDEAAKDAGAAPRRAAGKVLMVGKVTRMVMVSVGGKAGVKEGDLLAVRRDGREIARLKVEHVEDDFCRASALGEVKMEDLAVDDPVAAVAR